jgi:hypothetical protein
VRDLAKHRLDKIGTPETREAVQAADDELAAFVEEAVRVLKQAGLDAHIVDRTSIRIDPGPVWLNVGVFFDRRQSSDVWEFLVERSKFFLAPHKR